MVDTSLPPGFKHTDIGPVPEDWGTRPIGEIADIVSGGTPTTSNASYWNGDVPFCTPTDITASTNRFLSETERSISRAGLANSGAVLLMPGALLLCSRATIGEVRIAQVEVATNQGFKSLMCRSGVWNEFIYYQLLTMKKRMLSVSSGSTFLEISRQQLAGLPIPLPPLTEQTAIAEVLSDIDDHIASIDGLIAKHRDLKQAAMQALLTGQQRLPGFQQRPGFKHTDIGPVPEDWEVERIGDVFTFGKTANHPRSELADSGEIGYLHYGEIHTLQKSHLDLSVTELPRIRQDQVGGITLLTDGDIIVADASEDYAGVAASIEIKNIGTRNVVAGLHTILLRPKLHALALRFGGYVQYLPSFRTQAVRLATGISVYGLSKGNLASITIPLPPLAEQTAIAEVLSDMDAHIDALIAQRAKAVDLKKAAMSELLTGRIRLL